MPEAGIHSEKVPEGYRVTTTAGGLRIEPVGQQQVALTLDREALARFGLRLIDDHYLEMRPSPEATGIVNAMLGSIGRAIEVLRTHKDPAASCWDPENLKRAFVELDRLDEEGVQRILHEELFNVSQSGIS